MCIVAKKIFAKVFCQMGITILNTLIIAAVFEDVPSHIINLGH